MNAQPAPIPETTPTPTSRRSFLRRAGLASAVAAVAPAAAALLVGKPVAEAAPLTDLDEAILNFALQTEYLGAAYYTFAASGAGIAANGGSESGTGAGTQGTVDVKTNAMVPFSNPLIQQLANEFAVDELGHVAFVQSNLVAGGFQAYAMPNIDLLNSFNAMAAAAGLGASFDPFESDVNFLIGAFILDDTDVTAYAGSSALITNPNYLAVAAGILAVEAYHAGSIRANLYLMSQEKGSKKKYGIDIEKTVAAISKLKNKLSDGTTTAYGAQILGATSSQGIILNKSANITAVDTNSLAFERNPREVLNILYGAIGAMSGGFFPSGLNGITGFK